MPSMDALKPVEPNMRVCGVITSTLAFTKSAGARTAVTQGRAAAEGQRPQLR
jgi:hypothetical protein